MKQIVDSDEFDIDTFDTSYTDWIDSMTDEQYLGHCFVYCAKHEEEFTRYLKDIYRPIFDRLVESQKNDYDPD